LGLLLPSEARNWVSLSNRQLFGKTQLLNYVDSMITSVVVVGAEGKTIVGVEAGPE
jgi:hypothetical protein